MVLESKFEQDFCKKLRKVHPDILVTKMTGKPGIPDRGIFFHDKFCFLEFKRSSSASKRPLQDWYINEFGKYTYTAFVSPENASEVFENVLKHFGLPVLDY